VKAAIIYNPSAGRSRGEAIASAVQRGLQERGLEAHLQATERPGDAMTIARRLCQQFDTIVAVGGDGTVNEVANGIAGATRAATLAVVPAGTVNVLALELGLPSQVDRACDVIADGKTMHLDLGRVNGRGFTLMMGAGLDALTVRNIDLAAKKRYRELAFLGTGAKVGFAAPPPRFLVRVHGQEYAATFFVAGNCRYYAGRLGVTPNADPTDGMLDLLIFTGTTRSGLAVFWLGVPTGLHLRNPNVLYLRAGRAELIPDDEREIIWFQTDGELAGRLPAKVEIEPHAIDVLVP
jgi:diacylglycerol kinase (ATP)